MIPIVLLYLLRVCRCQSPETEFVLNLNSQMECCDEVSATFLDTSGVTVARYNETIAYMYGDIKFLQDVDSDTMVELSMLKEASGKYEFFMSHEICDLCGEVSKGLDSDYYSYMKYFGIPDECPFKAGDYPIKEFIVDTDDMPINSNTAGRYQAFLKMYKNPEKDCKTTKEFMCCLTLDFIIEQA